MSQKVSTRARTVAPVVALMLVGGLATAACSDDSTTDETTTDETTTDDASATEDGGSDGGSDGESDGGSDGESDDGSDDGSDGASGDSVGLDESFEADGWAYTLTGAELRESDSYAGKVLDLSLEGTNNTDAPGLVGTLIISVDLAGETITNCLADVEDPTEPGDSASVVVSCGLGTIEDPSLADATVTIKDISDEVVATVELG